MKKYILTNEGRMEAGKLKASKLCSESGLSEVTISAARKTGVFTVKTLKSFFQRHIPSFTEGIHYTKYNPNAVNCRDCQKELHDTQPHICEKTTTIE